MLHVHTIDGYYYSFGDKNPSPFGPFEGVRAKGKFRGMIDESLDITGCKTWKHVVGTRKGQVYCLELGDDDMLRIKPPKA